MFGGQFDPPHNGHLAVVRAARDQLGLDRVLVVPSAAPPHRPARRDTGRDALPAGAGGVRGRARVEVSRLELDRQGPSYTVDTLELLAGPGRELFLVLGADQLAACTSWHRPDRVRELARSRWRPGPARRMPTAPGARDGSPSTSARRELRAAIAGRRRVKRPDARSRGRGDRAARGCTPRPRARLIATRWGSRPDRHHPARTPHRSAGGREARHRHRHPRHERGGQLHRLLRDLHRAEPPSGPGNRRGDPRDAEARRPADAAADRRPAAGRLDPARLPGRHRARVHARGAGLLPARSAVGRGAERDLRGRVGAGGAERRFTLDEAQALLDTGCGSWPSGWSRLARAQPRPGVALAQAGDRDRLERRRDGRPRGARDAAGGRGAHAELPRSSRGSPTRACR